MTAATDTDEKYIGHAIYLEFRQGSRSSVNQMLVFSEMISPEDNRVIPLTSARRQISAENPQRRWTTDQAKSASKASVQVTTDTANPEYRFERNGTVFNGVEAATAYLAEFLNHIDVLGFGDWSIYREPLVTQISPKEATEIQTAKIPRSLTDRIDRMRTAAGYDPLPSRS